MKQFAILLVALTTLSAAKAQQTASREEALKIAFALSVDLKQMLATPIPTDPDVKRPVMVLEGERGGLVMPECKLSAEVVEKAGKEVVPVGQLWMRSVKLEGKEGSPKSEKLITATVGDKAVQIYALGVGKNAGGKLELFIYGKDKEPLLRLPLKAVSKPSENPIDMSCELGDESAQVTLRLCGKHEATFSVVPE